LTRVSVAVDQQVCYQSGTVSINQRNDSDVIVTGAVRGVRLLSTFNQPSEFRVFYGSSNECFPGEGICLRYDITCSVVKINKCTAMSPPKM